MSLYHFLITTQVTLHSRQETYFIVCEKHKCPLTKKTPNFIVTRVIPNNMWPNLNYPSTKLQTLIPLKNLRCLTFIAID